jgi:predicted TIM-barrel fold metal-dependent hydrolase
MTGPALFDANCTVGRHLRLQAGGPHTASDLLEEMDRCGIAEALVLHAFGRENHPADGNGRIAREVSASPRLHPVWSALPAAGRDEQPAPDEFLRRLRRHRIAAVALFPRQFRFNLDDWCVDAFLEPLAAAGVPVFLNPNERGPACGWQQDQTDWPAVVALCRRWPDLPAIVSEFRIRQSQRVLYRAFDACPNLRLELSGYWLHRGIEYLARTWGAHRLLFGSNWPTFGPHMSVATLMNAEIGDDERRLIGGDNLRRLIRWAGREHPAVRFPPAADPFAAFGRTGRRPRNMRFLDCHGHLGPYACHYHLPDAGLDAVVRDLDRLGVDRVCVFGFTGVFGDERPGNDLVAAACRCHPDCFVGFTTLNPHRGREAMLRELARGARLGLRGIKLIPQYQGYPAEGPLIDVACRWAHERRQIVLNHDWGSPQQMARLLAAFPGACFVTGHSTAAYADLMRKHPNLYVCSCPLIGPRACEELVEQVGAERLLFGSDLEDLPVAWGLGPILFARIPPCDKRRILGGNLRRILRSFSLR